MPFERPWDADQPDLVATIDAIARQSQTLNREWTRAKRGEQVDAGPFRRGARARPPCRYR